MNTVQYNLHIRGVDVAKNSDGMGTARRQAAAARAAGKRTSLAARLAKLLKLRKAKGN
jgi:hypothetical protein